MKRSKALYFAALLPPDEILEEIRQLKQEIKEKVGASHALKLPAHITLLPPFWLETEREKEIFEALKSAAKKTEAFQVELSDFGRFGQRVIFVKVGTPDPVIKLYHKLVDATHKIIPFKEGSLHPHMTLATRDLTKERFLKIWPQFQDRSFQKSFSVRSLYFFRHNGKTWDIYREFSFE